MKRKLTSLLGAGFTAAILSTLISCSETGNPSGRPQTVIPPRPEPKGYVCYRTRGEIIPDGNLTEADWAKAPWTDDFIDIEGKVKPVPRFKTHTKMLWDSSYLYIAAQLEEPHLWARLKQRDTVIFYDHDFEVFIDPDGDTHGYYELEVNALGTAWDLLLPKPYRDGGPAIDCWDIQGLKVGVDHQGTINNPTDRDTGWTVELALPLDVLREYSGSAVTPVPGDQWRINFSRVEWKTVVTDGSYQKETDPATGKSYPEDNWVWSPQGRINMHMPEMWGYVQFSSLLCGAGTENFRPDPDLDIKWALRTVYYYQTEYLKQNQHFAKSLRSLGLSTADFPSGIRIPELMATDRTFEAWIPVDKSSGPWSVREDGRLQKRLPVLPEK
ncbi:MAG: carbohydrate-binding family 9-like protein [Bacteroidota bacterium]